MRLLLLRGRSGGCLSLRLRRLEEAEAAGAAFLFLKRLSK